MPAAPPADLAAVELSLLRSRVRARVLLACVDRRSSLASQIAHDALVDVRRVRFAMHGAPPRYRRSLGLVRLGLVAARESLEGRVYEPTAAGREVAARLRARALLASRVLG